MGHMFLIDQTFYFIECHGKQPTKIHAKFNLKEKIIVENLNIPFENAGGCDVSLTYSDEL